MKLPLLNIDGNKNSSKVIGRRIEEIDLPSGTNMGAIIRGNEVLIAHDDIVISPDDHLILFVVEKKRIRDVEKLFENTSRLF